MTEKLDEDFLRMMAEVAEAGSKFSKHMKIRIEQWVQKLQQTVTNAVWKKHRNEYALVLLDMVKSGALKEPFIRVPPEGPLPKLSKIDVGFRQFPMLSAGRPRSKSPMSETQAAKNRTTPSPQPRKPAQPRSPSFGRDDSILTRGKDIMSRHFIHPLTSSKKRSVSYLPTVDNMTALVSALEAAQRREAVLEETVASQSATIREQQELISGLQNQLKSAPDLVHREVQVDDTSEFERLKESTIALLDQDRRIKIGQDELRTLQKTRPGQHSSPSLQSIVGENLEDTLLKLERMRQDINKISAIHYT